MSLLTCELSNAIDVKSLICDPTIAKDPKKTPTTISLSDLQGLLQLPFNSCTFEDLEATMRYCILHKVWPIFHFRWYKVNILQHLIYWNLIYHICKQPHLKMAFCWTLSTHPPCSHILHTCQPSNSPQKHLNPIHNQWLAQEHTYPLLEPLSPLLVSLPYEAIFFGSKQTPTSSCFVGPGFGVKTPTMQC